MRIHDEGSRMVPAGNLTEAAFFYSNYPYTSIGIEGEFWKLVYKNDDMGKRYVYCLDTSKFYSMVGLFPSNVMVKKFDNLSFDIHTDRNLTIGTSYNAFNPSYLLAINKSWYFGGQLSDDDGVNMYVATLNTGDMSLAKAHKDANWLQFGNVDMYFKKF